MKKIIVIISVFAVAGFGWWWFRKKPTSPAPFQPLSGSTMKLTSPVFSHNTLIPKDYTCDGRGIHPPLHISGVPEGAKSLVLIVDDPDAPVGLWTHWLMWNMSPQTAEIPEGVVPAGVVQGKTSSGENVWGPPCPPSGTHHYRFKLFALDVELSLAPSTSQTGLEAALLGHVLDQTELVGLYARQK